MTRAVFWLAGTVVGIERPNDEGGRDISASEDVERHPRKMVAELRLSSTALLTSRIDDG